MKPTSLFRLLVGSVLLAIHVPVAADFLIHGVLRREGAIHAPDVDVTLCNVPDGNASRTCWTERTDKKGAYSFRQPLTVGTYTLEATEGDRATLEMFRLHQAMQPPLRRDLVLNRAKVRTLYVTSRELDDRNRYTSGFGKDLSYGEVAQERTTAPCSPVALSTATRFGGDEFHRRLESMVEGIGAIVLYVHGYNVSFTGALEIANELDRQAVRGTAAVVAFSWPSQRQLLGYVADENAADISAGHLADFLKELLDRHPTAKIHLVAHSMGSRVVVGALTELAPKCGEAISKRIGRIVLAAPDIAPEIVARRSAMMRSADSVTIYFSPRDRALKFATRLSASHRLGFNPLAFAELPADFDLVSAGDLDRAFTGHSHLCNSAVQKDLFYLLRGVPAAQRFLDRNMAYGRTYYALR
jgi:esterase/lipase superfamily enzyme